MTIDNPDGMLCPAVAGDISPPLRIAAPRPEPPGIIAMPPDVALDTAPLDAPRQNWD
jgi:hypothetical protein